MLTITLVRHGNTNANNERWIQGQLGKQKNKQNSCPERFLSDTELNDNGLKQAKQCGERLKNERFDHVYCSDLKRCRQTASEILVFHESLTIEYRPGLREADFGKLSGLPIKALSHEAARLKVSYDQAAAVHGGETRMTFETRIIQTFETIVKDAKEKGYTSILIVTHGGPLRCLAAYWEQQKYQVMDTSIRISTVPHGNTAVTKITIDANGKGFIYVFNDSSHLDAQNTANDPPPAV
ncbi:hypothetical protein CU097_011433 [Rhizopus azygosporus]|uniref:Phosphoglycerate mutase n=1 Tax=Rhizopus azygosporus TaxID=86630 RepID=A0A367JET2_RHIAZ|nr:hypothetical protein CU097_011433 [Rhizopus azygosporus]